MVALRPGQPPSSVLIASCQGSWPPPSVLEKTLVKVIERFRRKQTPAADCSPLTGSHSLQGTVLLWLLRGACSEKNTLPPTPIPTPPPLGQCKRVSGLWAPVASGTVSALHNTPDQGGKQGLRSRLCAPCQAVNWGTTRLIVQKGVYCSH